MSGIDGFYGDDSDYHEGQAWLAAQRQRETGSRWAERERVRAEEGPSMARLMAAAYRVAGGPHADTLTGQRARAVLEAGLLAALAPLIDAE